MRIVGARKLILGVSGGAAQLLAAWWVLRAIERVALASIAAGHQAPPIDWLSLALFVAAFSAPFVGAGGWNALVHAARARAEKKGETDANG